MTVYTIHLQLICTYNMGSNVRTCQTNFQFDLTFYQAHAKLYLSLEWQANWWRSKRMVSHIFFITENTEVITELVKDNLTDSRQHQKQWYDKGARECELKTGEEVLVLLLTSSNDHIKL